MNKRSTKYTDAHQCLVRLYRRTVTPAPSSAYWPVNAPAQKLCAEDASRSTLLAIIALFGALVAVSVWVLPGCIAPAYLQSSAERRMCDCSSIATVEFEDAAAFPYLASEAKRSRVLAGYSQLKIGTPLNECVAFLGPPDRCSPRGPKLGNCEGVTIKYYLFRRDKNLVSDGADVLAYFEFDLNWRFVRTYPSEPEVRAQLDERMHTPKDAVPANATAPLEQR